MADRVTLSDRYLTFAKDNYERGLEHLLQGSDDGHKAACGELWGVLENYLCHHQIHVPGRGTTRDELAVLEERISDSGLHDQLVQELFSLRETEQLANLVPRIHREETSAMGRSPDTSAHEAFSSDFDRYRTGDKCKEPLLRLAMLVFTVRCNLDHGQKVLPRDEDEMRKRNALIFKLVAPPLDRLARFLFELDFAQGVFVYGTFMPGQSRWAMVEALVQQDADEWRVTGELYDAGPFPALLLRGRRLASGAVLTARSLLPVLQRMDSCEGRLFRRRLAWARSPAKKEERRLVWVYEFSDSVDGLPAIRDGIWRTGK